jgi:hypothetical protein
MSGFSVMLAIALLRDGYDGWSVASSLICASFFAWSVYDDCIELSRSWKDRK